MRRISKGMPLITAAAVLSTLALTGCLEFISNGDPDRILVTYYIYGLAQGLVTAGRWDNDSGAATEGPTQPLPQAIEGLQTSTSSVRTSSSSGGASPSLRLSSRLGAHAQATSGSPTPFSTNAYILDTINLYQMDASTGQVIRSLDLTAGQTGSPSRFALTSDGKFAIVSNENGRNHPYILVVDLGSFTVAATIQIPENANAYGVAITPDDKSAYVVTQSLSTGQDSVYVTDLTSRQISTVIPLPKYSNLDTIVMTPDGTALYLGSDLGGNFQIPLIDTASSTVTMDVSLSYYSTSTGSLLPGAPTYVAMHPDGTRLYLAPINGGPIFVLSTATNLVTKLIQVPQGAAPPAGTQPVFTPNGRYMFVLDGPAAISVVDTTTDTVGSTIPLDPSIANADPRSVKVSFLLVPGS